MTHAVTQPPAWALDPEDLSVPEAITVLAVLEGAIGEERGPFTLGNPRSPRRQRLLTLADELVASLWQRRAFNAADLDPDPDPSASEVLVQGDPVRAARVLLALEAVSFALGDAARLGDRGVLVGVLRREGNHRASTALDPAEGASWLAGYRGAVSRLEEALNALTRADGEDARSLAALADGTPVGEPSYERAVRTVIEAVGFDLLWRYLLWHAIPWEVIRPDDQNALKVADWSPVEEAVGVAYAAIRKAVGDAPEDRPE